MRGLLLWVAEGPALESTEKRTFLISTLMFLIFQCFSHLILYIIIITTIAGLILLHHYLKWSYFNFSPAYNVAHYNVLFSYDMNNSLFLCALDYCSWPPHIPWIFRPLTFFLRWVLLEILSGVTPRSESTLAIFLASTPQLGATLLSQRRWTFILQAENRRRDRNEYTAKITNFWPKWLAITLTFALQALPHQSPK